MGNRCYLAVAGDVFDGVFLCCLFFVRDVLDEIWDLTESVSESFPTFSSVRLFFKTAIFHFYYISVVISDTVRRSAIFFVAGAVVLLMGGIPRIYVPVFTGAMCLWDIAISKRLNRIWWYINQLKGKIFICYLNINYIYFYYSY